MSALFRGFLIVIIKNISIHKYTDFDKLMTDQTH